MATRMQQRRGTAAQWTSSNPILNTGEIGWEYDTNKFKIGDGTNHWADLSYFIDETAINTSLGDYVETNLLSQPDGVATLDSNGKLEIAQLPDVSLVTVHAVADQAARLALSVQPGDIAIQADNGQTYVLTTTPASTNGNWSAITVADPFPTKSTSDLAEGTNLYFTNERAQDAFGSMLDVQEQDGIFVTYDDVAAKVAFSVTDQFPTHTTTDLSEGTNLYFTDERAQDAVGNAVGTGLTYNDTTGAISVDSTIATKTYADSAASAAAAAVVDSSPELLNTLNELAAAINDDANFATTIANNIATAEANSNFYTDGKVEDILDNVPTALNTLNKIAISLDNDADFANTVISSIGTAQTNAETFATNAVSTHNSDTTSVHGIDDTAELATKTFAAELLTNATKTNITITGDKNGLTITAENGVADSTTDNLSEGTTNLYFTNERAQDAVGNSVGTGLTYDDGTGSISVTVGAYDAFGSASTAQTNAQNYADSAVSTHNSDTTNVHGITDTSALALTANVDSALALKQDKVTGVSDTEIGYLDGVTSGIQAQIDGKAASVHTHAQSDITDLVDDLADKAPLASPTFTGTVTLPSTTSIGDVSSTEIGYVNGVTSAIQTQIDGKASLSGATFTGSVEIDQNLTVDGDLTVNGTTFSASSTTIVIEDNLVQLAHQNAANTVDLGVVVGYNDGSAKHAGIVRDVSADKWKLFKGVTTEPTTTVDFTQGSLDDLEVAGFVASSASIGDVSNTELQYLNGVTSAIQTQIDGKISSSSTDTLTNKTIDLASNTVSGTLAQFNTAVTDADLVSLAGAETLTNKTIALGSNTVSGTLAQFNTAVTDADLVSIAGTETLTNKTLTSPTITTPTLTLSSTTSTTSGRVAFDATNDKIIVGDGTNAVEFAPSTLLTNAQVASYTLVLSDKDKLVEISNASATTLTVPLNSSVAYPVGSRINLLQTGAGQVTVAGEAGVTVNGTPGLKLRAQWSSATLIKRATDTWVLVGDLSA